MDDINIVTVDPRREELVKGKVRMALSFGPGAVDKPGYGEATLILCALLSAMASKLWPGEGKDKARFVELLTHQTPSELGAKTISVPLLEAWLRKQGRDSEARIIQKTFMPFGVTRAIQGEEVDVPEEDIAKACPELPLPEIRACSYAALLYSELRSGYAHEYRPGKKAVPWPLSSRPDQAVSYANQIDTETMKPANVIHFSVAWMGSLAIEAERRTRTMRPDNAFKDWWFNGRKKRD